jgi:hypothetical protein
VFVVVIKPCATQLSQKRRAGSTLFSTFFERFCPAFLTTKAPRTPKWAKTPKNAGFYAFDKQ